MNFIQFKTTMREFPVFSVADIRAAFPNFDRRRLSEWQKKGYIQKIIKGYYIFPEVDLNEKTLWSIANKIYKPSYVSLETAMAHYGLIPESVYAITSISTRRTYSFETPVGLFSYKTMKPMRFFGYTLLNGIKMATMEKAILDYLYIHPGIGEVPDFSSLRIHREEMRRRIDQKRFTAYLERFGQNRLSVRAGKLLKWAEED